MKKLLLSVMVALAALGMNAQTKKGEGSLMGSLGYLTIFGLRLISHFSFRKIK